MSLLTRVKSGWKIGLLTVLALVVPSAARAQIFVTINPASGNDTVAEYGFDGSLMNSDLASTPNNSMAGIAVSGSDLFVANQVAGTIGEYTTSGQTVNASLITGLAGPSGIAISGSDLFETNITGSSSGNSVNEYTTSGTLVKAPLISNLSAPNGIAVSGSQIFVEDYYVGTMGVYPTSGATQNNVLISGLGNAGGFFAVSGSDIFYANPTKGTIEEFTTTGGLVNASLISGLTFPTSVAVLGADLFVVTGGPNGAIGEYTLSGQAINANLITGLNRPIDIAVEAVPEPASWMLGLLAAVPIFLLSRWARRL